MFSKDLAMHYINHHPTACHAKSGADRPLFRSINPNQYTISTSIQNFSKQQDLFKEQSTSLIVRFRCTAIQQFIAIQQAKVCKKKKSHDKTGRKLHWSQITMSPSSTCGHIFTWSHVNWVFVTALACLLGKGPGLCVYWGGSRPWCGVMTLGHCLGHCNVTDVETEQTCLCWNPDCRHHTAKKRAYVKQEN